MHSSTFTFYCDTIRSHGVLSPGQALSGSSWYLSVCGAVPPFRVARALCSLRGAAALEGVAPPVARRGVLWGGAVV